MPFPPSPARGLRLAGAALGLLLLAQASSLLRGYDFTPPTREQALAALGSLDNESSAHRRLLTPDEDFPPIEPPGPGDWLAAHDDEPGQPYTDYVLGAARRVDDTRKVIYLQPIGEFPADSAPSLELLRDYTAAFFQLDVVLLPAEMVESAAYEPRINRSTKKLQWRSTAILTWLHERLPADAFCMVAVTVTDLYPDPSWNFVYGQASAHQRAGVFSFARHDAMFFGRERPDDFDALMLRRSAKTLVHEIAHIFGLAHCIYFQCVENGVNHEAEGDSRPHHLCPICLRKLRYATGADLEARYRDLAYFFSQHTGWDDEEAWVKRQLAKLRSSEPARPVITVPVLREMHPREPAPPPLPAPNVPVPTLPMPPSSAPLPPSTPAPQSGSDLTPPPITPPATATEPLVALGR